MNSKDRWIRGIYMLIFFVIGYVLRILILIVAVFQFLSNIIFEKSNKKLLQFGQGLSMYSYEVVRFLTYNTEQKPYPFDSWPSDR